jgi:integrase
VASLGETTRERHDDLIRIFIDPTFGDVLAAKLDAEMLERFYARLQQCRELCSGRRRAGHTCRPLSGSTVRKIHFIVSGALELAVRWRHLGVNRAALARAPSPSRPEPDPPSAAEAPALLNAAWADPDWGLLLWLTMVTGLRRGEVSALRWSHVDALAWSGLASTASPYDVSGLRGARRGRVTWSRARQVSRVGGVRHGFVGDAAGRGLYGVRKVSHQLRA